MANNFKAELLAALEKKAKVHIYVMVAQNPPVELEGYLEKMDGDCLYIREPLENSMIHVNLGVCSIAILEVVNQCQKSNQ